MSSESAPAAGGQDLLRMIDELKRELGEAHRREAATAEILDVISRSRNDVQPVFDTIVKSAVRLCDGLFSGVYQFDGELLHHVAHYNYAPEALEEVQRKFPARPTREFGTGRAILEAAVVHIPDVEVDPEYRNQPLSRAVGMRSGLFVPMLRDGAPAGVVLVARAEPGAFSDSQINLLKSFADQAVVAIENARLFEEVQQKNQALTVANTQLSEALEQQTATGEILRVIARSPTDIQPAFDTIASSAARLCEGFDVVVFRVDGDVLRLVAHHGPIPAGDIPLHRGTVGGRTVIDRRLIHVDDLQQETDEFPEGSALARQFGNRTLLSVPLLKDDVAIGNIQVRRNETRPFSSQQMNLLETFADQAVIAIENARLLDELRSRTDELARSVAELHALGQVGQAVSSSLELNVVLPRILEHACDMSKTGGGAIYVFDKACGEFHLEAGHNMSEEIIAAVREHPIRLGESVVGQCAERREAVQFEDLTKAPAHPLIEMHIKSGVRALLAVPLLHQDEVVGALVVRRRQPGAFPDPIVNLMQTFANQSAIAVHNARLFHEIEDKGRQLEIASQHKSQFVANMSHELRTPLAAMLGYAELLQEGIYGALPEKAPQVLARIQSNGKHLLGLINTVLDISKIESGQFKLNLSEYALSSMVETVRVATEVTRRGQEACVSSRGRQGPAAWPRRRAAADAGAAQPRRQRHQVHG